MNDFEDNINFELDKIDEKKHNKLIENLLSLNKNQQLKKPSRTEPTLKISEFDLVKPTTSNKGTIEINNLTNVLNNRKQHAKIKENITIVRKHSKTLPKPLDKPKADRIRRGLEYEKTRLDLDRWEPIVTSNRSSVNLTFPLNEIDKIELKENRNDFTNNWRLKTKLQEEIEKIDLTDEPPIKAAADTVNKEFQLTAQEIIIKRKEAAQLRAYQSRLDAKARRQNKIKSKKYHRLEKREKIKQKLKEFEELQKSNPEEALNKLNEIETARIKERFSLRHRSTGKWAQNKQIRAKYDKESRQALAQQLTISKELTKNSKIVNNSDSDDFDENDEEIIINDENKDNPWINSNGIQPSNEVQSFLTNYQKFCEETQNQNKIETNSNNNPNKPITKQQNNNESPKKIENITNKKKEKISKKSEDKKMKKLESLSTTPFEITPIIKTNGNNFENVDQLFSELEYKFEKKIQNNLKQIRHKLEKNNKKLDKKKLRKSEKKLTKKIDLTLPKRNKKQIIDKELIEENRSNNNPIDNNDLITNLLKTVGNKTETTVPTTDIDPNKFVKAKITNLNTSKPDLFTVIDENDEFETNQQTLISEAFKDDDIIDDFQKDKLKEIEKNQLKPIVLKLPGWGDWIGPNIQESNKRKEKRLIFNPPKKMPRSDDNKGNLIIKEKGDKKIKEHMVNELPFPFTSVKDYEASVRAPIGNTFVPEIAFRKNIKPIVHTKLGAIITPIKDDVLINLEN